MQNPTSTEHDERQAELREILADKGLEAATDTAIAHALSDLAAYPQYGPDHFADHELLIANADYSGKGGPVFDAGDLVLVKVESGLGINRTRYVAQATRRPHSVELDHGGRLESPEVVA